MKNMNMWEKIKATKAAERGRLRKRKEKMIKEAEKLDETIKDKELI